MFAQRKPAMRLLMQKLLEGLAFAMALGSAFCMLGIVGLISVSVVMRKLGTPVHMTEEVTGLLLSVCLFLGLPMVTLKAKHVRVTILVEFAKGRFNALLHYAALLIALVFFGWMLIESWPWLEFALKRNLKTETARVLLYPWMAMMPLSLGLTFLIYAARLAGLWGPVASWHKARETTA